MYKEKRFLKRDTKRKLFFYSMLAFPVFQFCLLYFYVNFSSLTLAFKKFEIVDNLLVDSWAGFGNFSHAFEHLSSNLGMVKNSVIYSIIHIIVGIGGGTLFSYYIFKEYAMSNLFKVFLFLPNIVATIIFVTIYKYLCNNAYISLMNSLGASAPIGLLEDPDVGYWVLVLFNVWLGFGTTVLMMSGAMGGINESCIESAKLDGVNSIQEFIFIVVPLIYPTLSTFIVVSFTGLFTNTMHAVGFFDYSTNIAPTHLQTYGYRFFLDVRHAAYTEGVVMNGGLTMSQLSAIGLVFTVVTYTIVMTVKKLLKKFGPSVD